MAKVAIISEVAIGKAVFDLVAMRQHSANRCLRVPHTVSADQR